MNYRPELDGLRSLAVMPVIIYHLKIPVAGGHLFSGGFLGVDIFFVISGFLISRIILDELRETGRFSVANFYARRARRILPALILVILATMLAGHWLLTPSEMTRLGQAVLATLGFVSNFYWFETLGQYGAQSGLLQPLLHTWSLAIEEQFYLVFPLLLLVLAPARRPGLALGVILALFLASLLAAELATRADRSFSFFSPASRAWELLAGTLMAMVLTFFPGRGWPGPVLVRLLPKAGLAVLVVSMLAVDLAAVIHPGLVTLPAVLATAAIIWCARPGEGVTRLLSSPPLVAIGKLSYSLYLWHFPIFAFGRLGLVDQPGPADMALWLGLTGLCAMAGHVLVERPLRFGTPMPVFALTGGASLAAVAVLVILALRPEGVSTARSAGLTALYGGDHYDNELLRDRSWALLDRLAGPRESIGTWNAHEPSRHERERLWFTDPAALGLLVVGNSHSKDMFNALHFAGDRLGGVQVARFGMDAAFPEEQRRQLFAAPNFQAADVIVIAPRYAKSFPERLPGFLAELAARGKIVALAGNTAEFGSPGSLPIYDYFLRRRGQRDDLRQVNGFAFKSRAEGLKQLDSGLRALARASGAIYLSRHELVCSEAEQACTLVTPAGAKTMYDYGHWTLEGAAHFGDRMVDTDWLRPLIDEACMARALCTPPAPRQRVPRS